MTMDYIDRCKHCSQPIIFRVHEGAWIERANHTPQNDLCPANHNGPHHPVFPVEGIDY